MPALTAFATALFNVAENAPSDKLITLPCSAAVHGDAVHRRVLVHHPLDACNDAARRPAATAVRTAPQRLTQPLQHRKSCQHMFRQHACRAVLVCTDRYREGAGGSGGHAASVPVPTDDLPRSSRFVPVRGTATVPNADPTARPSNSGRSGRRLCQ
jgi:hypothetical protein